MTISSQATKSYLLKKQEAICEELGNKDGMPRTCGNQALMLQAWGHLEEAMELHKKEQAICEELGDLRNGRISADIGETVVPQDLPAAIRLLRLAKGHLERGRS